MSTAAILYLACAVSYAFLATLILVRTRLSRTGWLLALCCLITTGWATATSMESTVRVAGIDLLELVRAGSWYAFVLHLYRKSLPGAGQMGRTFGTMGLVAVLLLLGAVLLGPHASAPTTSLWSVDIVARLGIAICELLLIENLYLNTPAHIRWHVAVPCIALGALCAFDILICADLVIFRHPSTSLFEARAVVVAIVAPLLAVAAARDRNWKIDIHVSRIAVFHSATLILSGVFLLGLAAAGEVFRRYGADWGVVGETSLLFGGVVTIGLLLTSGSARSRIRTLLVEHFFSNRYDYRREWLRCINALSDVGTDSALPPRVIRAVSEIVDSPAGILFLRDADEDAFRWAGSWNMPVVAPPVGSNHPLVTAFRDGTWVVEANPKHPWPAPLDEVDRLWLAVPLAHGQRVIGFILTAKPRASFRLDQESYDLLRIVAREVASYIAEQRATQILIQTRQLHDYGKRFSFVAHDIKNVSSQLSLLLSNAEEHIQNPEFQHDMLATVSASIQKISTLLKRLEAPDTKGVAAALVPLPRLEAIVATFRRLRPAEFVLEHDGSAATVAMSAEAFDTSVTHLLNNAVEAARCVAPIRIIVRHEALRVQVDIVDCGAGMTADFIRDELFRPFKTSKREGSGIGAFQARELLRDAGGDLFVLSRPGAGTTMRMILARADVPAMAPLEAAV